MKFIIRLIVSTLAVFIGAYLLKNHGITLDNFRVALLVALLLAVSKAIIKPLLVIFTLPLTILTFGLFLLIINGFLIIIVDYFVGGFQVSSIWIAILFSIVISLFESIIYYLVEKLNK